MLSVDHASLIRLGFFLVSLLLFLAWQTLKPYREADKLFYQRWPLHLAITFLNSFLLKLILPIGLAGFAHLVSQHQWGILNRLHISLFFNITLSLILLDLLIYWQHRLFHKIPFLWNVHRFHHKDLRLDCTSALRFNPLEMLLSLGIKVIAILTLGISSEAVIIFEVLLNSMAMFNHANIRLPHKIEHCIRTLFVTPDMHRIHHSDIVHQSQHNFGFNLSLWDRLFNSYLAPSKTHSITFGVKI